MSGHTSDTLIDRLFHQPAPILPLILLAGVPLLLAGWVLLSRDIMLTVQNLTDLLFNLAGAWQHHQGRIQHEDFREAIGPLNFRLTQAGFHLVGLTPFAFLAGQMLAGLGLLVLAVVAAVRRLPLAAAVIFTLSVTLPAVMPTNIGNPPDIFTFAMAYNRYGWSAISILCLILFAPRPSRSGDLADLACALILLLAMFYLKITYFLVGIGALALALLISAPIRTRWRVWGVVGLLALGNALAPHSHGYLADILWAIRSGLPSTGARRLLLEGVLGNSTELGIYGAGLLAALWLWRQGRAGADLPLTILFLIGAAIMLFTQNTQARGLPLGAVGLFILYGAFSRPSGGWLNPALLLTAPALSALTAAGVIAAYGIAAVPSDRLLIAQATNIRGIAVPMRAETAASLRPQTIYLTSLLDAAALFAPGRHPPGRIRVIDRVNPLPFMLGFPPPTGGEVFWEPTAPPRPAEEMLGDADYVLLPTGFSSSPGLTAAALTRFAPYLTQHFRVSDETEYWRLYTRITPR